MHENDKVKIIYIVGFGHSGTTLVSRIMGSSPNCFNVGEIYHLQDVLSGKHKNSKCDDGEDLEKSEFWSDILNKIDLEELLQSKVGFLEKIALGFRIFFGLNVNSRKKGGLEDIKLYKEVFKKKKKQKNKEVKFLVESSKSLRRLIDLDNSKEIDLRIIYIVRDGRGVLNSFLKRGKNIIVIFLNWFWLNLCIKKFIKKIPTNQKIEISYERLANDPGFFVKSVNEKFSTKVPEKNLVKKINAEKSKTFCGNPMRKKKIKEIRLDSSWKRRPFCIKFILNVLCYLPNKILIKN